MAFKKHNEMKTLLLLVLTSVPLIVSTHIDCAGRSFHCVNNTHFMICVDLGGGVSMTVDGFTIPCPPSTTCHPSNRFECEFEAPTPAPATRTTSASEVTKELSANIKPWEKNTVSSIPNINTRHSASSNLSTFSINEATILPNTTVEVNNENKTENNVLMSTNFKNIQNSSISPTHKEENHSILNATKDNIVDETGTLDEGIFLSENSEPVIKPSVGLEVSPTNPVEPLNTSSFLTGIDLEIKTITTNMPLSDTTTPTILPSAFELNQVTVNTSFVMSTDILNGAESPDLEETDKIVTNKNNLTTPQDLTYSPKKSVTYDSVNNGIMATSKSSNISTAENTVIDVPVYCENNIIGDKVNNKMKEVLNTSAAESTVTNIPVFKTIENTNNEMKDTLNVSTAENTVSNLVFNRIKDTLNTSIAEINIIEDQITDVINTTTATEVPVYNENNKTDDTVKNKIRNALNDYITERSVTEVPVYNGKYMTGDTVNNKTKDALNNSINTRSVTEVVVNIEMKDALNGSAAKNTVIDVPVFINTSIANKNVTGDALQNKTMDLINTTAENTVTEVPVNNENNMTGDTANNKTNDAVNTSITEISVTEVAVNNEMNDALNISTAENNRIKDTLNTSNVALNIIREAVKTHNITDVINATTADNTVTEVPFYNENNITEDAVKNKIQDALNINITEISVNEVPVNNENNMTGGTVNNKTKDALNTITKISVPEVAFNNEMKNAVNASADKKTVIDVIDFNRIKNTRSTYINDNNITGDTLNNEIKNILNTAAAEKTVTDIPISNKNKMIGDTVNNEMKDVLNTFITERSVPEVALNIEIKDALNASAAKNTETDIPVFNRIKGTLNTFIAENYKTGDLVINENKDALNTTTAVNTVIQVPNYKQNNLTTFMAESSVTDVPVFNIIKDTLSTSVAENIVSEVPVYNGNNINSSMAESSVTVVTFNNEMKDALNASVDKNTVTNVPVFNRIKYNTQNSSIADKTTTGDGWNITTAENTVTEIPIYNENITNADTVINVNINQTKNISIVEYTVAEEEASKVMMDKLNTTEKTESKNFNNDNLVKTSDTIDLTTTGKPNELNPISTTESVDLLNNLNELELLSSSPTSKPSNSLETTTATPINYMITKSDHNLEDTSLTEIKKSNYIPNNNLSTRNLDQIPITNATSQYETATNFNYLKYPTQNKSETGSTETQITNIAFASKASQNIITIKTPISTLAIGNTRVSESDQSAVIDTGMPINNEATANIQASAILEITGKSLSDVISNRISNEITDTNSITPVTNISKPGTVTSEGATLVTEKELLDTTIVSKNTDTSTADNPDIISKTTIPSANSKAQATEQTLVDTTNGTDIPNDTTRLSESNINLIASQSTTSLNTHLNPTLEQTVSYTTDNTATEPSQGLVNITAVVNSITNYTSRTPEPHKDMASTDDNKIARSTDFSHNISIINQNSNSANSILSGVDMNTDSSLQNAINAKLSSRQGKAVEKLPIVTVNQVATEYQNNIGSIHTMTSKTTIDNSALGTDVTPQTNNITIGGLYINNNNINVHSSILPKKTDGPNTISTPNKPDNFEIRTVIDNISGSNLTNLNESKNHSKLLPIINNTLEKVNGKTPIDNIVNLILNSSVPSEEYNVNKLNSLHPTQSNILQLTTSNDNLNTAVTNNENTPSLQTSNFNNSTSITKTNESILSIEILFNTLQKHNVSVHINPVSTNSDTDYTTGISATNVLPKMVKSETKSTLTPNVKLQNGLNSPELNIDETQTSIQNRTTPFKIKDLGPSTPDNSQLPTSNLSVSNDNKNVFNTATSLTNSLQNEQTTVSENSNDGISRTQNIAVKTKSTATTNNIDQSSSTIIVNVQNRVTDNNTENIRSTTLKTIIAPGSSTVNAADKINDMAIDVNHKITSTVTSIQDLNKILQTQNVIKEIINKTNGLDSFKRMPSISVQDKTNIVESQVYQNGDIVNREISPTNKVSITTSTSKTTNVVLDKKQKETNLAHSEALDPTSLPSTATESRNKVVLQHTSNSNILNNYLVNQQNIVTEASILSSSITENVQDILHVNKQTQKLARTLTSVNNVMNIISVSDQNSSGANSVSQSDSLQILEKIPERRIGHEHSLNTTQSKQSLNVLDNNKSLNIIPVPESKRDITNSINIIQPLALVNPRNNTNNQELHFMKNQFSCINRQRGKYGDNDDCRKFYICIGHLQPIVGACPVNTVFSEIKKQCTRNPSHCIRNNELKCTKRERFIDLTTDNTYYICAKNSHGTFTRFKFQCQKEYTLDKSIIQCVHSADNSNQSVSVSSKGSKSQTETKHTTAKPTGKKYSNKKIIKNKSFECEAEGKYPISGKCREYYVCSLNNKSEFRRRMKKCDSDEVFDKDKNKCVDADSYEC